MIALLDANSFFASCEKVFRPDLLHQPVLVLSSNDGCVIARCPLVKRLNLIPMGAPYFKIKHLIKAHNIQVFSSNFSLYKDMSTRMMAIIKQNVENVHVYSIDEAFMELNDLHDPFELCRNLREKISKGLGLPTAIGVAPTKVLAKAANYVAKNSGICYLKTQEDSDEILKKLAVKDVWGIGKRSALKLASYGIHTAFHLKTVDPKWIRRTFSVSTERLVLELNGLSCLEMEKSSRKSIQVSRSFSKPLSNFEDIKAITHTYTTKACQSLRQEGLKAKKITVSIMTNPFSSSMTPFYQQEKTIELPYACNDTLTFLKETTTALKSIIKEGLLYKKTSVTLHDFYKEYEENLTLDLSEESIKKPVLDPILDSINKKFGSGTIHFASTTKKVTFSDSKKHTSPCYTTKWEDILTLG